MASIKISSLPVLEADRLTDDDQFIVNDANAATTRLSYGAMVGKIASTNLNFTGAVEFSGTLTITGDLNASNVYTKEQTDAAIEDALVPLKADIEFNAGNIADLVTLTGQPRATTFFLGSEVFAGGTEYMKTRGSLNITTALQGIDFNASQTNTALETLATTVDGHTVAIAELASLSDPKGRVTLNEEAIAELQDAVGVGGGNITGNTDNIANNVDNIYKLATAVGAEVGIEHVSIGGTILSGNYKVVQALTVLDGEITGNKSDIADLDTKVGGLETTSAANFDKIKGLETAIQSATNGFTGTAEELAAAIDTAVANYMTSNFP